MGWTSYSNPISVCLCLCEFGFFLWVHCRCGMKLSCGTYAFWLSRGWWRCMRAWTIGIARSMFAPRVLCHLQWLACCYCSWQVHSCESRTMGLPATPTVSVSGMFGRRMNKNVLAFGAVVCCRSDFRLQTVQKDTKNCDKIRNSIFVAELSWTA